jgi:hypothetical protein
MPKVMASPLRDVTCPEAAGWELHLKVALGGREDCPGVSRKDSTGKVPKVRDEVDKMFFVDAAEASGPSMLADD